jgi:hypothetical protein
METTDNNGEECRNAAVVFSLVAVLSAVFRWLTRPETNRRWQPIASQ